jgi:hypothetical protein
MEEVYEGGVTMFRVEMMKKPQQTKTNKSRL